MTITKAIHQAVLLVPASAWTPAVKPDGAIRDGARVAELAGDVLKSWPTGMRLIVRKERPHPCAQLRFTDADGMRLTCFATNTTGTPIAALKLRHRQRARAEDRIRAARDTDLRNLPLHDAAQNRIWLEIVQIALDLLAWMPMLALDGPVRRWEPKRPRLRLFSAAAQLVTTGRRLWLRLARHWPWTDVIIAVFERLQALPNPDWPEMTSCPDESSPGWGSGTRRPPDATVGPRACLHPENRVIELDGVSTREGQVEVAVSDGRGRMAPRMQGARRVW